MVTMENFQIAFIKPNKFNQSVEELTEFVETRLENNEMMNLIIEKLDMTPDMVGDSIVIHESGTHITQMMFIVPGANANDEGKVIQLNSVSDNPETIEQPSDDIRNVLAEKLTIDGRGIWGTVAIIKSRIGDNNTCVSDNVDLTDILNIIKSRDIHWATHIDTKGKMTYFQFNETPLEYYKELENNKKEFGVLESPLFNLNLIWYYEKELSDDVLINKSVTRMLGNYVIRGDVIIAHKITEDVWGDLNEIVMNQLAKICYGPMSKRRLVGDEVDSGEKRNNLIIATNPYRIIHCRADKWKDTCGRCGKVIVGNKKRCGGCYRVKYCDQKCQQEDWYDHKDDCLKGIKPVN